MSERTRVLVEIRKYEGGQWGVIVERFLPGAQLMEEVVHATVGTFGEALALAEASGCTT